jgi:MFS family permease
MKNEQKSLFHLFWVQFFGALNDNVFKNALVILLTYQGINLFGLNSKMLVAMAGGVFILPFLLFSSIAGEMSHKYDRIFIVRWVKKLEVLIMIFASMGFYLQNYYLLFAVLFLLGIHSTFFGPIKYSLIPQYVPEEKLVFANALISAGTFISILLGTILGGFFADGGSKLWSLKFILILISALGVYFAFKLDYLNEGDEKLNIDYNIVRSNIKVLKMIISDKEVYALLFGLSWFWFLGAGILSLVPLVAKDVFKAKEAVATLFLFTFTLGMGIGPFVLDKFTKGKVMKVIIPISLFMMSVFLFDISFVIREFSKGNYLPEIFDAINLNQFLDVRYSYRILIDLFFISFFGGIFTVLQFSELQSIVDVKSLSHVIAGNNIFNAIFMVAVSLLIMIFHQVGFSLSVIFGIVGVLNIGAGMILVFFHRKEFDEFWSF